MKHERWTFDKWMAAQFGPRPAGDIAKLRQQMLAAREEAAIAEALLRQIEQWETWQLAARYMWRMSDAQKVTRRD